MPSNPSLLDLHEVHEIALAADLSSDPHSVNSSPTLVVSESSLSSRSSACSSPRYTPSVKFGPLPQIDPHRQRSLAPLGVSARSRRKRIAAQEAGSLLWADPSVPEELMEDPLVTFGKFIVNATKHLWRRVRKRSTAAAQKHEHSQPTELVIEVTPGGCGGNSGESAEGTMKLGGGGVVHPRRASWSSPTECWTLTGEVGERRFRRSTGDLPAPATVSPSQSVLFVPSTLSH
ncbi:hypothetical protein PAXRUDRAFT_8433 [Paxillus rubicundulus Ve08.2h10]|uniref:Uncharacterized protein n=1 Tax=Paxillus rubicundulus Ve08.2h10 TaxID=930991 RepID=A0A0D0DX57_9AGAM|nr:hypothetical protein PAXRUDRAFT_8433 [Paxillus rubicundulus Ve08.2h10]